MMGEQAFLVGGIWAGALLLWLAFLLFYDGFRRPLTRAEIDAFLGTLGDRMEETGNDSARLRAFLEDDDGREFVMVNLVRTRPGQSPIRPAARRARAANGCAAIRTPSCAG